MAGTEGRHQETEVREDQREEDVDSSGSSLQRFPGRVRDVSQLLPRSPLRGGSRLHVSPAALQVGFAQLHQASSQLMGTMFRILFRTLNHQYDYTFDWTMLKQKAAASAAVGGTTAPAVPPTMPGPR